MKRILVVLLVMGLLVGKVIPGYSSDWDKAGKALTIIEGMRILTAGKVDILGTLTGINRQEHSYSRSYRHPRYLGSYSYGRYGDFAPSDATRRRLCRRCFIL